MARGGDENMAEVLDAAGVSARPPTRLRLGSIREIRRELVKLYQEARRGDIESHVATRLTFMLQTLAGLIKDHELEQRIAALEAASKENTK